MPETKNETKVNKEKTDIDAREAFSDTKKNAAGKASSGKSSKNSILFYVLTIITALLLVMLIIGSILFIAVKNNVNGIADSMGDSIRNIPVLSMVLPAKPDHEDEKNMTEEQVRKKYKEIKEEKASLEKQISDLNSKIEQADKQLSAKDTNSALAQKQKGDLEKENSSLTAQVEGLKKDFAKVSDAIAKGDTASFKSYFEKIDPKTAADLYAKILTDEKMSADAKKYCSIYQEMDPSAVASIMEKMGTAKMNLIVEILKNLKKDVSAGIIAEMTPSFAAKVSEQLAKAYNFGTAKN
jgi:flagellar motility protein MotE (MotC chaperone)